MREGADVCVEEGAGAFCFGGFGAGDAEAILDGEVEAFGEDGFADRFAFEAHGGKDLLFFGADGHHAVEIGAGTAVDDEAR